MPEPGRRAAGRRLEQPAERRRIAETGESPRCDAIDLRASESKRFADPDAGTAAASSRRQTPYQASIGDGGDGPIPSAWDRV
jgi:hypothetical protein